MLNSKIAKNC